MNCRYLPLVVLLVSLLGLSETRGEEVIKSGNTVAAIDADDLRGNSDSSSGPLSNLIIPVPVDRLSRAPAGADFSDIEIHIRGRQTVDVKVTGGIRQGGVRIDQVGKALDFLISPLESGDRRVIDWGGSGNREFRDREPEQVPRNRTRFDDSRSRIKFDPRSENDILYEEEQRIPRSEIAENLNLDYLLTQSGGAIAVGGDYTDTGGYGGLSFGLNLAPRFLGSVIAPFSDLVGYEAVTPSGNFFYKHAHAMSDGEPIARTGVLSTLRLEAFFNAGSYDWSTGGNETYDTTIRTRFTETALENFDRDPGTIHLNRFQEITHSDFDLTAYQIGGVFGLECFCLDSGISGGLFFPMGIQINDWEGTENRRFYQNGRMIGQNHASVSGTDTEWFTNIEARCGIPLGACRLEAFIGTQLCGGTTVAEFGGSRAAISSDAGDNVYGGVSLSVPFEDLFRPGN